MVPIAYLLDANVVSEMMRPYPADAVADCLDGIARDGIGLASVTVWEILNGIGRLPAGKRRSDLSARFTGLLADYFEGAVLDWAASDAAACARLMEDKRRRGEPLDDHLPDAFLAGMARHRGFTVVTRNEAEFRNTGASILNPWREIAS